MSKRRTHSPEFKARVPMEAISGRKTIQEIAADHAIHPIQVSQWKRQLLDGASELFTRGKKINDKEEGQANAALLHPREQVAGGLLPRCLVERIEALLRGAPLPRRRREWGQVHGRLVLRP